MPELNEVKDTMKFDLRLFMETLLEIIEDNREHLEGNDLFESYQALENYILDQAEYARDCGVID